MLPATIFPTAILPMTMLPAAMLPAAILLTKILYIVIILMKTILVSYPIDLLEDFSDAEDEWLVNLKLVGKRWKEKRLVTVGTQSLISQH